MEYGYQPGLERLDHALRQCRRADAMLLSRAALERHADRFEAPDAPTPVVRLNWTAAFYYSLDYRAGDTMLAVTVEEAVRAGAGGNPERRAVRGGRSAERASGHPPHR